MKIKNLAILIASVLALLLTLIVISLVYAYIDASRNGKVLISDVDNIPQSPQLGELVNLQLNATIPWGQEISQLDLKLHDSFITAGEPNWTEQNFSIKGRIFAINLPFRAIRPGKTSIGTLYITVDRPMYRSSPTRLQLHVDLPEIDVVARQITDRETLPLAGELSKQVQSFHWQPTAIITAILLLIGILLWCFRKQLFQRSSAIQTPWDRARKRLYELRDLAGGEKTPEWCIAQLTDLLRDYLAERFDLPICQQTTGEFFDSLRKTPSLLSIGQASYLEDFLTHADLIKFAGFRATPEQLAGAIDRAEKLIDETADNTNKSSSETSTEQVK